MFSRHRHVSVRRDPAAWAGLGATFNDTLRLGWWLKAMAKHQQVGIPIDGGIITFEPSGSTAMFWIREMLYYFAQAGFTGGRSWTPLFIVIWNSDRSVEFYREGPYRNRERKQRLNEIRTRIRREGLDNFLFNQRSSA
jgi:hypothetical protein